MFATQSVLWSFPNDQTTLLSQTKKQSTPSCLFLHHFPPRVPKTKMATMPSHGFRLRHQTTTRPFLRTLRSSLSSQASLPEDSAQVQVQVQQQPSKPKKSYFPKRGQTLELVCESLGFKGKGLCKVADTGFVVMCDRALPGERFIGRVTRKKDNYAEVLLLLTLLILLLLVVKTILNDELGLVLFAVLVPNFGTFKFCVCVCVRVSDIISAQVWLGWILCLSW